jgi:TPR repeat protein
MKWFRKAAEQGVAEAQNDLGAMYHQGQGVPQDYAEAMKWFRKAAEQGQADAQSNLGVMYVAGQGVPQDYVQAYLWFILAAAQGNENAAKNRGLVAAKMTSAEASKAKQLVRDWLAKHQQ